MKHNDPAGIGNAMSFGPTPLSAKHSTQFSPPSRHTLSSRSQATIIFKTDWDTYSLLIISWFVHFLSHISPLPSPPRQRGSTLFLTTNVVFPEPTRPSPLPRFMYSRDLDLCPSVCYDVVFPGGRN